MIDLHCHILPGVDDGARNPLDSLQLLELQKQQGIDGVVFTPHFNIDNISLEEFLSRRQNSLDNLLNAAKTKETELPRYKCAAEVYLTPKLLECDLKSLCIENTDYMLVELAFDYYRQWTDDILYHIRLEGITPVIAHIERYSYFTDMPDKLFSIVDAGALVQVNASSIVKHQTQRKQIETYLKHQLVHVVASDAHSVYKRPPVLNEAFNILTKSAGKKSVDMLFENAENIFCGNEITPPPPTVLKKIFGIVY